MFFSYNHFHTEVCNGVFCTRCWVVKTRQISYTGAHDARKKKDINKLPPKLCSMSFILRWGKENLCEGNIVMPCEMRKYEKHFRVTCCTRLWSMTNTIVFLCHLCNSSVCLCCQHDTGCVMGCHALECWCHPCQNHIGCRQLLAVKMFLERTDLIPGGCWSSLEKRFFYFLFSFFPPPKLMGYLAEVRGNWQRCRSFMGGKKRFVHMEMDVTQNKKT